MLFKAQTIGFFSFFFFLFLVFFNSLSEKNAIQRDPATLNGRILQISNLSHDQIKSELQKKIKITPTIDGKKTISFLGFSSTICKTYPSIQFNFVADNVVVDGEAPSMKITAPCEEGQDPSEIASIKLPIEKILNEKVHNAEFTFDGFSAVLTFQNSADEWPRQWILKRIEFRNPEGVNKFADFGRSPASANNTSYSISDDQPIVLEF